MNKVYLLCVLLSTQLIGCVHLTESFQTRGEADIQEIYSYSHTFMQLRVVDKKAVCRSLRDETTVSSDRLAQIKHAYLIMLYRPCGGVSEAIKYLKAAKLRRIDRDFDRFLTYQIAVMENMKSVRAAATKSAEAHKQLLKENEGLQRKLDEIRFIEKNLNNRVED